ncbi:MAG: hypothetical protein Q8S43_07000 [Actinomycetota bacterium]|nr:MAG: hypothetical protein FD171_2045 [Actinomycetota bacterium]MDO8950480.1 hypothetical protein [Actinomycetota bacterium]MDP3630681.1 hypothetical protein [Actinomycetota bacterium]
MLPILAGLIIFLALVLIGAFFDPIGWGYLLSGKVDVVADARLSEPLHGIPVIYFVSVLAPGVGVIASMGNVPPLARAVTGIALAIFLLVTMWDMRRRRGTLAVYIRLRREELSFHPMGDVIEVPKLMFGVMNQPGPVVWLLGAFVVVVRAIAEFPHESWLGTLPLVAIAAAAVYVWFIQRRSIWEPLAKRLRAASFIDGDRLVDQLEAALDVDPEVIMVRRAADAMVARVISGT